MNWRTVIEVSRELEPLMPKFLGNREDDVQRLADAIMKKDLDTVKRIGHSLKGIGGGYGAGEGYGFGEITEFGRDLEDAAINGNLQRVTEVQAQYAAFMKVAKSKVRYV